MSLTLVSGYPLVNSMTPAEMQIEIVKLREETKRLRADLYAALVESGKSAEEAAAKVAGRGSEQKND